MAVVSLTSSYGDYSCIFSHKASLSFLDIRYYSSTSPFYIESLSLVSGNQFCVCQLLMLLATGDGRF